MARDKNWLENPTDDTETFDDFKVEIRITTHGDDQSDEIETLAAVWVFKRVGADEWEQISSEFVAKPMLASRLFLQLCALYKLREIIAMVNHVWEDGDSIEG